MNGEKREMEDQGYRWATTVKDDMDSENTRRCAFDEHVPPRLLGSVLHSVTQAWFIVDRQPHCHHRKNRLERRKEGRMNLGLS